MNRPELAWQEHCAAVSDLIEQGETDSALDFLVAEKFAGFLRVARTDKRFKDQLGPFAEHIRTLFEPWDLQAWFQKRFAPPNGPQGPATNSDVNAEVKADISQDQVSGMYLLEDAEKWLIRK